MADDNLTIKGLFELTAEEFARVHTKFGDVYKEFERVHTEIDDVSRRINRGFESVLAAVDAIHDSRVQELEKRVELLEKKVGALL